MKSSTWIPTLPEQPGQEREDRIFDAVLQGGGLITFTPLEVEEGGNHLHLDVALDALRVGEPGDSVRVATNALTASAIAEVLGCLLPTAKLCDLIWLEALENGIILTPHTQTPDAEMANTSRFVAESESIDAERDGRMGLLWTVGKSFVLSNKVFGANEGKAANYGWHVISGSNYKGVTPGVLVLQPLASAHVDTFTDYSQLVTGLVKRRCYLNGKEADLADVLTDPEFASLVSSEGALQDHIYPRTATHGPKPYPGPPPAPEPWRVLRKGMEGEDVKEMQERLIELGYSLSPYGADGDFGSLTDAQVRSFQSSEELVVDGIVGSATRAALEAAEPVDEVFVQARNYTPANRDVVDWIMIHTMEAVEKPTTALAVANWFASANAPMASAHWCIDSENTVGCVREVDVAWGCGGANRTSVHYELAGFHYQGPEDWSDDFSQKMLERAAKQAAETVNKWGVPIAKITPEDMRAGKRGFCGHIDGTLAFGKSTHIDPGPSFPWDQFLEMVEAATRTESAALPVAG